MIHIVIDANLFVSAILKPDSRPAEIISLVRDDKIKLLMSEDIENEIRAVLLYPKIARRHKKSKEYIDAFFNKLRSAAIFVIPKERLSVVKDDPSDNKYLECAVTGNAQYILTGDSHLKEIAVYKGIRVLTAADFLAIINRQK